MHMLLIAALLLTPHASKTPCPTPTPKPPCHCTPKPKPTPIPKPPTPINVVNSNTNTNTNVANANASNVTTINGGAGNYNAVPYISTVEAAGPCSRPTLGLGVGRYGEQTGVQATATIPLGHDRGCLSAHDQQCIAYAQAGYHVDGCPDLVPIVRPTLQVQEPTPAPVQTAQPPAMPVTRFVYRDRCKRDATVDDDLALIHRLRHHKPNAAYNAAMDRLRADCAVASSRINAALDDPQ